MKEVLEVTELEDQPHVFAATFQEPSVITSSGTGPTPVSALLNLVEGLTTRRNALAMQRDQLTAALLEELNAVEEFLASFWDT